MAFDKLVNSTLLNGAITATAAAIREKTGGSDLIPWDETKGFADVVSGIEAGGGVNVDEFIEGRVAEISSNTAIKVGQYAFYQNKILSSVNIPAATIIEKNGFAYCTALASVNAPEVTDASAYGVFAGCTALSSVNMPKLEKAGDYCFQEAAFSSVNFPELATVGNS